MSKWKYKNNIEKLKFKEVSENEIEKYIKKLKTSSSFGHDKIDARALKIAQKVLIPHITYVINLSISKSKFINKWRIGKVIPLYKGKKVSQLVPSSYRPISLLPLISKIAERVIQTQLVAHFDNNCLWSKNQHGYRKNHSTTTTLLQIADMLFEAADAKEISSIITVDESAAFDSVEKDILLEKLKIYGLDTSAINWVRTYLEHRTQYVSVAGQDSSMLQVEKGVPQGSVLGPVFFTIFTNELEEVTKDVKCRNIEHTDNVENEELFTQDCKNCGVNTAYADDSTSITNHKSRDQNQQQIAENLHKIATYLQSNRLTINQDKTQILEVMLPQKRSKIAGDPPLLAVLNNKNEVKILEAESSIRLLGMNLGNSLNWTPQLQTGEKPLISEIKKKLGSLNLLKYELPRTARWTLANGIILAKLQYMMPVWGGLPTSKVKLLQSVLNATARFVTGMKRSTSAAKLMANCEWLFIKELIKYHSLLSMWRILNDTQRNYFDTKITVNMVTMEVETVKPRLKTTSKSFRWRTTTQWNSLPITIRKAPNIAIFKKNLRKSIISERVNGKPP